MDTDARHKLLEKHFGFREFLEGQERVIETILDGHDALVIMPTGGGKSLCYQFPALALEGITVVVSPLIALMKDQVDALTEKGIAATFINSSLNQSEIDSRISAMTQGKFRIVYIAPERFKSERFTRALAPLSIALFAIDEAHCISQWGHDFRPDYLRLKWALKELGQPQVVALTATATPEVRDDIVEQLALGKFGREPPKVFVSGFARHNLLLAVANVKGKAAKLERIIQAVRDLKTGIVYCATRKNVEKLAAELGIPCVAYHGAMTPEQRKKAQDKFMDGECAIAVATNAFGMGIDRPDLRFVIHYDIPGSVEAYYQEAGRAGRDGEPARCEMLFNYADVRTQEFFIDGANPTREIIANLHFALNRLCNGGPIELPISEIAKHVPAAKNEMAIGTGLYLLERAGFIQRNYRQGSRTYTTRLVEPVKPLDELEIDFERLESKRERDFAKLHRIIDYADHRGCRHHFILDYFGDTEASPHCTVCDNCLAHAGTAVHEPTEEEVVIIQKALSCVARVNGRFGRARIAQTLVGSRSKEVVDVRLDQLSTYGLLAEQGAEYVWSLLDALIRAGCVAISSGQYPTLSLTVLGREVMLRNKTFPLAMPERVASVARSRKVERKKSAETAGAAPADYDAKVFEALRKWRRDKAAALGGVPGYLVFPDKTLQELARQLPERPADLLSIRGIGAAKAQRFGEEALAVIKAAR
ncbi:MAG TPA: RecQ family ATP-dependent DNA helicase [Verrucomicrobiae bacterium]|nr:RecQ family ATP-dependent DNA helicase [Verrucomicrobiae bacterium]